MSADRKLLRYDKVFRGRGRYVENRIQSDGDLGLQVRGKGSMYMQGSIPANEINNSVDLEL